MTDKIDRKEQFTEAMSAFVGEDYERSIAIFDAILEKDPNHKLALTTRGAAHLKRDDPEAAAADFDRALEIDSTYARAFHLRGLARTRMGRHIDALGDFDQAVALAPQYGAAYLSRASVLAALGEEDRAAEDMEMVARLTNANLETFASENNIWRSHHMRVEEAMESELNR